MARHCFVRIFVALAVSIGSLGCAEDKPQGQCPAFSQCGGAVDGTWTIGSSCVEGNLTALANLNPVLPVACQGMYQSVTGTMTGTVAFNAGTADINTKMSIAFQTNIDASCANANGVSVLDAASCASQGPGMVPVVVEGQPHSTITCTMVGGLCGCSATDEVLTQESRSYTTTGSSIFYTGSKYPLDYCVNGAVMSSRQFDANLISTVFINATR